MWGNVCEFFALLLEQTEVFERQNRSPVLLMALLLRSNTNPIQFASDALSYWLMSHTADTDNSVKILASYSTHAASLSKPSPVVGVTLMSAFVNENSHFSLTLRGKVWRIVQNLSKEIFDNDSAKCAAMSIRRWPYPYPCAPWRRGRPGRASRYRRRAQAGARRAGFRSDFVGRRCPRILAASWLR